MTNKNEKTPVGQRTVMGFDFGTKSIGIAIGQEITGTANSIGSVKARDGIPNWDDIAQHISDWKPDLLVVGLPLNMDGTNQQVTFQAKKFANRLHNNFKLQVETQDERLTTTDAKARLFDQGGYRNLGKSNEAELMHMTATAAGYDEGPSALRYPRGSGTGVSLDGGAQKLEIGKARQIRQGRDIAILSLGTMLQTCEAVADNLHASGVSVTLVDARFAKPFDKESIKALAINHPALLIVEESSPGGFSAHVLQYLASEGCLDGALKIRTASLPDTYLDHAERSRQLEISGLDAKALTQLAQEIVSPQKALGKDFGKKMARKNLTD